MMAQDRDRHDGRAADRETRTGRGARPRPGELPRRCDRGGPGRGDAAARASGCARPERRALAADAGLRSVTSSLPWLTAKELGAAFAGRRLSPVELVTALLARITALDPKINA